MTSPEPTPQTATEQPAAATAQTPEAPPEPSPTETPDPAKRAIDAMKAERDAERRERAKLAARLKEIEDRDLSELQKAQRDREEAIAERDRIKSEAEQLRAADLRNQVALQKGLPPSLVARLQGSTADELAADADSLLALMNNPRSPLPDPGQGTRPSTPQDAQAAEFAQHWARMFPTNQQQT